MPMLGGFAGAGGRGLGFIRNPILAIGTKLPTFGTGAATYTDTLNNAPTNAGWTLQVSASADDATFGVTFPFTFYFYGTGYTSINPGSNTYILAGSGSTAFSGLTLPNVPAIPGIQLGSADNSWQRVWSKSFTTNYYGFRYEGTASTSGTPGTPNIVYEAYFFKNVDGFQYIEVRFGSHSRTTGAFGIQNGSSSSVSGGTITANQSYVFRTDGSGNSPTIFTGYHIE